jgi:hypothetical protein
VWVGTGMTHLLQLLDLSALSTLTRKVYRREHKFP